MTKLQLLKQQLQDKQELALVVRKEITELKAAIRDTRLAEACGCEICVAYLATPHRRVQI